MAAYKLLDIGGIIRTSDGVYIPADVSNTDYQTYLDWVADGGVPDTITGAAVTYKGQALIALYASDITIIRCLEAGVAIPEAWKIYRAALRIIADNGAGPLPTRPDYPEGT